MIFGFEVRGFGLGEQGLDFGVYEVRGFVLVVRGLGFGVIEVRDFGIGVLWFRVSGFGVARL